MVLVIPAARSGCTSSAIVRHSADPYSRSRSRPVIRPAPATAAAQPAQGTASFPDHGELSFGDYVDDAGQCHIPRYLRLALQLLANLALQVVR